MSANDHLTVVGVFNDQATAERAVRELHEAGFTQDEIGFAMREVDPPEGSRDAGVGSKAGEGAVSGIVTGGVVGGVAAAAVSLLVPGVGPIIGGGLLASVLGGAAAGAATGGLVGAFIGMGVPEEEARYYNNEFEAGRALVTVRADTRYREAADIIEKYAAPSREEQDRTRDFAANPMSAAIEESAVSAGSTAAGTVPEADLPRPFQSTAAPDEMSEHRDDPAFSDTVHPRPSVLATNQHGTKPAAMPQRTASVSSGGPIDSSSGGTRLHTDPHATEADPATMTSMDQPDPMPRTEGAFVGEAATSQQAGEPVMTGPGNAGRWPTRADDPQAGKYVVGEERTADTRGDVIAPADEPGRSPDAANGEGPYVSPDEDLERVGATSGMARRQGGSQPPGSAV